MSRLEKRGWVAPVALRWTVALLWAALAVSGCGSGSKGSAVLEEQPLIVETIRPEREEVPQAKVLGTVVGGTQAPLAFAISGPVEAVSVREGDKVGEGQELIRIRATDALFAAEEAAGRMSRSSRDQRFNSAASQADVDRLSELILQEQATTREAQRQAEAKLLGARARLGKLLEGASPEALERATAERDVARVRRDRAIAAKAYLDDAFQRLERLSKDGAVSGNRVEEARFRAEDAQRELELSERDLRSKEELLKTLRAGPRPIEVQEARAAVAESLAEVNVAKTNRLKVRQREAELRQARAALDKANEDDLGPESSQLKRADALAQESVLRAPFSGQVQSVRVVKGQWVEKGIAVVTLAAKQGMELEATPLEEALSISPGMRFEGEMRDLPRTPLRGKVRQIIPGGGPGGIGTRIRISLVQTIPAGTVVRGTIQLLERSRLWVPIGAIVRDGRSSFLWVSVEGEARKRQVAVGTREGGRIEILAGVTEENRVIISPPRELKEGLRIRAIQVGEGVSG